VASQRQRCSPRLGFAQGYSIKEDVLVNIFQGYSIKKVDLQIIFRGYSIVYKRTFFGIYFSRVLNSISGYGLLNLGDPIHFSGAVTGYYQDEHRLSMFIV
jgi:hypothetical protein